MCIDYLAPAVFLTAIVAMLIGAWLMQKARP